MENKNETPKLTAEEKLAKVLNEVAESIFYLVFNGFQGDEVADLVKEIREVCPEYNFEKKIMGMAEAVYDKDQIEPYDYEEAENAEFLLGFDIHSKFYYYLQDQYGEPICDSRWQ